MLQISSSSLNFFYIYVKWSTDFWCREIKHHVQVSTAMSNSQSQTPKYHSIKNCTLISQKNCVLSCLSVILFRRLAIKVAHKFGQTISGCLIISNFDHQ